jgi:hypothetical protein
VRITSLGSVCHQVCFIFLATRHQTEHTRHEQDHRQELARGTRRLWCGWSSLSEGCSHCQWIWSPTGRGRSPRPHKSHRGKARVRGKGLHAGHWQRRGEEQSQGEDGTPPPHSSFHVSLSDLAVGKAPWMTPTGQIDDDDGLLSTKTKTSRW